MKSNKVILIAALVLGLGYGFLSAVQNQNPYDHAVNKDAWHWQPSAVWLPSYLLCKVPTNGFGISHTRSGYLFRSEANRRTYFAGSTILGGIIVCLTGCVILAVTRKKKETVELDGAAQ